MQAFQNTFEAFVDYLAQRPQGRHHADADRALWDFAAAENSISLYERYIAASPKGVKAEVAKLRATRLRKEQARCEQEERERREAEAARLREEQRRRESEEKARREAEAVRIKDEQARQEAEAALIEEERKRQLLKPLAEAGLVRTFAYNALWVAFSSDGSKILSVGARDCKVWDVDGGHELYGLTYPKDVDVCGLSPDGRMAFFAGSSPITLWDVVGDRKIRTFEGICCFGCVAFSPDGNKVLSCTGEALKLLDVATGRELLTVPSHCVRSLTFSTDGRQAFSIEDYRTFKLWDLTSGKALHTFTHDFLHCVAFSSDGQKAVSGGPQAIKVWDLSASSLSDWVWEAHRDSGALRRAAMSAQSQVDEPPLRRLLGRTSASHSRPWSQGSTRRAHFRARAGETGGIRART